MYKPIFTPAAERYFKKLKEKSLKNAYREAILQLGQNPYQGKQKSGDLAGIYGYDVYYSKTNYEIAYRIIEQKDKKAIIIMAGTRQNFYKELKRYLSTSETRLNTR